MLHILAKALHVGGQPCWDHMQPEEILPYVEDRDCCQDRCPDDSSNPELDPNAPTQFLVPNWRTVAKEGPQKKKWREQQSQREFKRSRHDTPRPRHVRMHEGPEFFITLGGQIGVVQLMRCAVQAETHQAQDANNNAVDFIKQPALSEQSVRGLMKADQHTVHQ